MSRYYSYLNSATEILSLYKGGEPFASFSKKYFAQHKKYGSKDRKQISHLCYSFFRLGKAFPEMPVSEKIITSIFLCAAAPDELLAVMKPEWNEKIALPVKEKFSVLHKTASLTAVFPWAEEISADVAYESFCVSFLVQPDLFLRARPGKKTIVAHQLTEAGIPFEWVTDSCLALPAATKVNTVLHINKDVVIQDHSSQQVGLFMADVRPGRSDPGRLEVWDCCAGSGGKSIMAFDVLGDIKLTVSDIRESILINLAKRFEEAGISNYKIAAADLTKKINLPPSLFDLVIADVPCTGSGTWSRTPEQLYFFDYTEVTEYAAMQKKIVSNAMAQLKPGGYFLYITCSVFKKENEEVVEFLKQKFHLQVLKMELIKGYDKKADILFAALLQQPL
ncbi:MAG: methyltransferase domain-containing protein [Chitinophagaceae bacterium]